MGLCHNEPNPAAVGFQVMINDAVQNLRGNIKCRKMQTTRHYFKTVHPVNPVSYKKLLMKLFQFQSVKVVKPSKHALKLNPLLLQSCSLRALLCTLYLRQRCWESGYRITFAGKQIILLYHGHRE